MSTVAPREVTDISEKERQAIIEDLTSDAGVEMAKPKVGAAVEKKDSHRDYVVLRKQKPSSPSAPQAWEFVQNVEATSNEQAIRKTVETESRTDEAVTFVAVPARSFAPVSVSVKTTTQIILT